MHPNHNFLVVRDLNPAQWIVIFVLPHMHMQLWAFGMHLKLNFEICGPGLSGEDTGDIASLKPWLLQQQSLVIEVLHL